MCDTSVPYAILNCLDVWCYINIARLDTHTQFQGVFNASRLKVVH